MWCIDAPEFVKACLQALLSIHVTTSESGWNIQVIHSEYSLLSTRSHLSEEENHTKNCCKNIKCIVERFILPYAYPMLFLPFFSCLSFSVFLFVFFLLAWTICKICKNSIHFNFVWEFQFEMTYVGYIQLIQKRLSFGNLKFKLQNTKYKKKLCHTGFKMKILNIHIYVGFLYVYNFLTGCFHIENFCQPEWQRTLNIRHDEGY